jgi:hypothetical protein
VVIALASRSNWKRAGTSEPVGLRARKGSSPFPGALSLSAHECSLIVFGADLAGALNEGLKVHYPQCAVSQPLGIDVLFGLNPLL